MGSIVREYGYIMEMLKDYPFDKQIEQLIEDLSYTANFWDENWWIKGSYSKNEKALDDLIRREGIYENPKLQRLLRKRAILKLAIEKTDTLEWKVIKACYCHETLSIEQASARYLPGCPSNHYVYEKIVRPFFERVDNMIWASIEM